MARQTGVTIVIHGVLLTRLIVKCSGTTLSVLTIHLLVIVGIHILLLPAVIIELLAVLAASIIRLCASGGSTLTVVFIRTTCG